MRALLVFVLAAGAMTFWWHWRVEVPIKIMTISVTNYDSLGYYYPTFRWAFEEASRGHFPLWNPHQLCGTPFFALAQHLLLYPLNVLFWILPTSAAMKATAIGHFALATTFMFVLGSVFGLAPVAGVAAGLAFALSGDFTQLIYVPHHLYGAAWIPLHIALTRLVLTRRQRFRFAALLGFAVACQYLGGYPMYCLFSAYAMGGYFLWWLATERPARAELVAGTAKLAAAGGVALVLSAPQLLPAAQLARESPRDFGALGGILSLDPFPIKDLFGVVSPVWSLLLPEWRNPFAAGHLGVVALVLAAISFAHRERRRETFFFFLLAAFAWSLALGSWSPVFRLYATLPTGSWFRVPSRFLVLADVAIAMLAGIGTDFLWRDVKTRRASVVTLAIVGALLAWSFFAPRIGPLPRFPPARYVLLLPRYLGPICAVLALYVLVPSTRFRRVLVGLVPVAVFVELFFGFLNFWPIADTHPDFYAMPPRLVSFLREVQGFDRTYIVPPPFPTGPAPTLRGIRWPPIPLKSGMLYGLSTVEDRENLFSRRFARYLEYMEGYDAEMAGYVPQGSALVTPASSRFSMLSLMSARFLVVEKNAPFAAEAASRSFPRLYEGDNLQVFLNPFAQPRVLVAGSAEVLPDPEALLARLVSSDFQPGRTVLLEEPSAVPDVGPAAVEGTAHIVTYEAEEVVVEARSDGQGFLVLNDQYYPGWTAEVDGQRAPLLRANFVFRAVPIGPGTHRVVFRFAPSWTGRS
jgi:hypothetical protein